MTELEKCDDKNRLNEGNSDFIDKYQNVLLDDKSPDIVETSSHDDVMGTVSITNNIISNLENKLLQRDNEINNLRKLAAKYERQLEKANKYNEDLRNELSLISCELHKYRCRSLENKSVETQVTEAEIEEEYGNKPMPDWGTDYAQGSGELSIADSLKAAAEAELQNQLKTSTCYHHSESEQQKIEAESEYVFDETSGLYYHSSTGYYWDPNYELFYDNTTGTYYQYSEKSGEYEIHSQVDMTEQFTTDSVNKGILEKIKSKKHKHRNKVNEGESSNRSYKKKLKKKMLQEVNYRRKIKVIKLKKNAVNKCREDVAEAGEFKEKENMNLEQSSGGNYRKEVIMEVVEHSDCDSESSGSLATGESELVSETESGELTSKSSSSDEEILGMEAHPVLYDSTTEMAEEHPPCIRVIVQSSEILKCGSLYIITCSGGSIGRDKNKGHAIEINDINVSKVHAEIVYVYEKNCYSLLDKGSQNGTVLNGNRLSYSKSESDSHDLHHNDVLQIGSTEFLLHIHKGNETCDSCEPGQVQAKIKAASSIKNDYVILSQEEKNEQRKKELKNIKKKYGLQNSYYDISGTVNTNSDFCDKAYMRRKCIGSESEFFKHVAPASVQSPISAQNKGHKLLAKMGWKEGQGLGKSSSGVTEPINVELRLNQNAGFGSTTNVSLSLDNVQHSGKAKRWAQARKRFEKLKEINTESQEPLSSQMSPVKTVQSSNNLKSLPIHPESVDGDSFSTVGSCADLDVGVLSPTACEHSSLPNELLPILQNPWSNEKCLQQTSKVHQQKLKMLWVSGGTEQL